MSWLDFEGQGRVFQAEGTTKAGARSTRGQWGRRERRGERWREPQAGFSANNEIYHSCVFLGSNGFNLHFKRSHAAGE